MVSIINELWFLKSDTTATMCAAADSRNNDGASPWNGIVDELVVKRSFYLLLEQEENAERFVNVLQRLGQLPYVDEDQRLTVERSSERVVHLIYSSPQPAPWKANDFASRGWVIDSTNVYSEFSRVAEVIFQDDINWGRIVAFIGFAVAFSVHSVQNGLEETVIDSIFGWTIQVIRGRLHSWLQEHSWESFISYADRVIQRTNGVQQSAATPSLFDSVRRLGMTVGAVGIGTVLAVAVRHAFS